LTDFLAPPQQPGELGRLGSYRILKVLGTGGMGVVYQAEDPQLKRPVALKAMLPALGASASARARFLREAQAAAAIEHDNIVHIYQVGEDRGVPFLAMQFLQGEPLEHRLKRERRLPLADVLRIGRETAEGLAAAHQRGLIHRDIKPANLWLEGTKERVKILDFGLARVLADQTRLTQSGAIVGTPAYMAPEQAGGRPVDHRCDLFSLGCVLYQMCTGERPFKGSDTLAIISALALENPTPPRDLRREIPSVLSDLVMQLLAKDPQERPATAHEVVTALQNLESDTLEVPSPAGRRRALAPRTGGTHSTRKKRGAWWVAIAAILILMLGLGGVGIYYLARNNDQPNPKPGPKEIDNSLGWVPLFNGKDLAGWKLGPQQPGNWTVDKGILIGKGPFPVSHLFTERGDFQDFHLRAEAKINLAGNSGIYFRSPYSLTQIGGRFPTGYEAQIFVGEAAHFKEEYRTGSLYGLKMVKEIVAPADAWFTMEIIARGNRITIKVNGVTTVDEFEDNQFQRGHFALQQLGKETVVEFRKIEVKELK
jgi:hypothetical protein